jgi:hypothetical protein
VKATLGVLERVDLNDPAHFSAVFGRKARRVNGQGLNVVCLDHRPKTGRAVARERDSIHDKLGLILGLARVQDGVALIEPSRLRTHKVSQGLASLDRRLYPSSPPPELIDQRQTGRQLYWE